MDEVPETTDLHKGQLILGALGNSEMYIFVADL